MKILDAHVHLDRTAGEDILRMAWGGVEAAIVPSPHLMSGLFYPKTLFELWVVGIGEIGLDTGNAHEQYLLKAQLAIAKEHDLPIIMHTPTPRQPQTPWENPKKLFNLPVD
jgi:predicted metal-dependent TIM-barrel fold hydrolase